MIDVANPLPKVFVREAIDLYDPLYSLDLEKKWKLIAKTHGQGKWLVSYLSQAQIYINRYDDKAIDIMLSRTFQVPRDFDKVLTFLSSAKIYREVIDDVFNCGYSIYDDTLKLRYISYTICQRRPEISGQIMLQLAEFIEEHA